MSHYRKIWVAGVRLFVVREPNRVNPVGVFACRKSKLPIGLECRDAGGGWVVFDVLVHWGGTDAGE